MGAGQHSEKYYARARVWRLKRRIEAGVALPMFADDASGCQYSPNELARNIRIGNALHLRDLRQERNAYGKAEESTYV